jgi:hypothetical protein
LEYWTVGMESKVGKAVIVNILLPLMAGVVTHALSGRFFFLF